MARQISYLDYNATAPLRREAREAIVAALDVTGNPSSVHASGRASRRLVEQARERVGSLAGVAPGGVIFTSGATEANNMAIHAAQSRGLTCLVSAVEHESVANVPGVRVVPVTRDGLLDLKALGKAVDEANGPVLLALMAANNETGAIQPVEKAAEIVRAAGGVLHCDAVQAAGRLRVDKWAGQVDSLSISAHKLGGPQGVGALIFSDDRRPTPLIFGGAQEDRRRAGTENVAGIAGFGAAAQAAVEDVGKTDQIASLRNSLEHRLAAFAPDLVVLSAEVPRLANTLCFATPDLPAETQVMAMDLEGYAISAGSACSSGKVGASHVPLAMGIDPELARCAIRVSIGRETSQAEIDGFAESWGRLCQRHRASAA